ncbi:hypothetical protein [Aquibaculum sediminis]|uniref:hypothetical protein n=1 Tax=Aquibaculum sediminis TaxID=3231907 RepID=UPI0034535895
MKTIYQTLPAMPFCVAASQYAIEIRTYEIDAAKWLPIDANAALPEWCCLFDLDSNTTWLMNHQRMVAWQQAGFPHPEELGEGWYVARRLPDELED